MFMDLGLFEFQCDIWESISQDRPGYITVTTSHWLKPDKDLFLLWSPPASE